MKTTRSYLTCILLSTWLFCMINVNASALQNNTYFSEMQAEPDYSNYAQALTDAKKILALATQQKNTPGYLHALLAMASAYQAAGQHHNAINTLNSAMPVARELADTKKQLIIMVALGQSYAQAGLLDKAEQWLRKAAEEAVQQQQPQIEASARNNLGNLLLGESHYKDALTAYRKSAKISSEAGLPILHAQASANAARAALTMQDTALAQQFINTALQTARTLEASHETAYLMINTAVLLSDIHSKIAEPESNWLTDAYQLLKTAQDIADQYQDGRAKSWALGNMAQLYLQQERTGEALTLTREAEFIAQQYNMPDVLFRWQWQAGKILDQQGKTDEAIVAYQQAIATLQPIRYDIAGSYGNRTSAFREIIGPLYFELADLLLRRSPQSDKKTTQAKLREARKVIEMFQAAELEDYFKDDCVAQLQARTTGIDKLETHTAVIYPILLQKRTELLVSLPTGIQQFTIQVGADDVIGEIRSFRRTLEKRTTHQYLSHAKKLHTWLIDPITEVLRTADIRTLVIVPDGALRTIPWGALYDGKDFLIEQYAIAYTPGLEVTDPRPLQRQDLKVLLSGLTTAVQDFPALPFVKDELERINKLYGGTILLDENFNAANLQKELGKTAYSVVHIASHGQFSDNPEQTFLLTHDGKITMDKLSEFVGIGRFRDKPIELLTLSACQTAAGDDRAALGLAGVAVKSGARSALATLWFVNDQTTSLLISDFYQQLKEPSTSKAEALQRAQIKILSDRRYRHPGYWSPYLLIGNWL
ncbi:MAG: hypothetical protein BMS9Abin19_0785 [Gammaproteobacteria bacterium]|nr:MAG: hypothetical protein BMS9Abin19_0785 [Gammaproteobacteria bacterium]